MVKGITTASDPSPSLSLLRDEQEEVIRKYGGKAHTSGLHRDINVCTNFLSSRRVHKPRERAGGRAGPETGRPPRCLGQSSPASRIMLHRGVSATLWPSCAAMLAAGLDLPELIADGMLDKDGLPTGKQIPPVGDLQMNLAPLAWTIKEAQKHIFRCLDNSLKVLGQGTVDLLLCNTAKELEEGVLSKHPSILPIGPLPTGLRARKPVGNFWAEDDSCQSWLDAQPDRSVIYVAFGSLAVLDQKQFHELARGLELSERPFLWVVRPGLVNTANYPDRFVETVEKQGKIVTWSPQHRVLAHPAVACFVSHCGWNSVMEGVRNGLTWPYFADQFINESYVCDVWKTGLRLVKDAGGAVTSEHIAACIENLLNDPATVSRALELQHVASRSIGKDGTSLDNLTAVINALKG